jgi:hypothetical protein
VMKGLRDGRHELDSQRKHKPCCEATNECFVATKSASGPSRAAKDKFVTLITPSEKSTFYLVMGPNQLIDKIAKKKGVICL